jgi:peptide/nickel transport system substrate-binding protein
MRAAGVARTFTCVVDVAQTFRVVDVAQTFRVVDVAQTFRFAVVAIAIVATTACIRRPVDNPNIIVMGMTSGPNNLDARIGSDDTSQKIGQLIYSSLMTFDDRLRVVPQLAERLDHPDPRTYVVTLRRGVKFHDGHELTSADVVYTFRSLLAPGFVSPLKGAYRLVSSIDARDRYTVVFSLHEPFGSFPVNLVLPPIVPDGAGPNLREHPIGTGPYKFVRYLVDDRLELAAFDDYYGGRPRNDGLLLRFVPDHIMQGLELRKGTMDLVINDIAPDIVHQLERTPTLQEVRSPGTDYQYIGLNLRDPMLKDVRVRQALAYAIDYDAIIEYLRRGLAYPAVGIMPPVAWAFEPDVFRFTHDPAQARRLLDEAGYADPDGDGPRPRFTLSLKVSNIEFNRLQSAVIQQNFRAVGVGLDVRMYEFATLYADVLQGNFQLFTLQWTGGAAADPDILRRVFHSQQVPPSGFNRGYFSNPRVDELIDRATVSTDDAERIRLFGEVQKILAREVPYISLWDKTNYAVAQRTLDGIHLRPAADLLFLKDVARTAPDPHAGH